MLSFIRKRLPSKDRSNEHLQNIKSNHIRHDDQDNEMKRTQSANELDSKKKKKKKERPSSTADELIIASNPSGTINQINKSYSDVDYFPMMSGGLSQSPNHDKTSKNRDSLSDCYLNPSESVQTTVIKARVFQIPVIDCRKEQRVPNYNDVDHERTKALREVTEQRIQKKSVK